MNVYIVLIVNIVLNSLASILLKIAVTRADKAQGISSYILNPYFIGAIVSFGCAFLAYSYVLTKIKLSIAYPVVVSACFLIIVPVSWLYLKEQISELQLIGIFLITGGIWLVLMK